MSALAAILLLEYIALVFKWSPERANDELLGSIAAGTWIIILLSKTLSRFKLTKGVWAPIAISFNESDRNDFNLEPGMRVNLELMTSNPFTNDYLPNNALVLQQLTVSREPYWYLVQLELPANEKAYLTDKAMIRIKDPLSPLSLTNINYFGFFLIPLDLDLTGPDLERMNLIFCGWTVLKVDVNAMENEGKGVVPEIMPVFN